MQSNGSAAGRLVVMGTLLVACGSLAAGAQTSPSGQVTGPAARAARGNATVCQDAANTGGNMTDPNCAQASPGFAAPTLEAATPDSPRAVTALVRVDALMKRPPVALPDGNSFTLVGTATLIKVRRPDQEACLATGKRISARVNAATSTTCLDHKGELLAVEECAPGTPDCAVVLAADIARQQTPAVKP